MSEMTQSRWNSGWQFLGSLLMMGGMINLTGCFAISFAGAFWAIAFSGNRAIAQITPDKTLGAESSIITPNVNINGTPSDRINGGAVRGANLFHSFQQFNVGEGGRVYFANPPGILNILSRVTGSDPSHILGTLGVDGKANLFLLNPNGIIFGPNAKLDIRGTFVGTTADSLIFENGIAFNATNATAPPLLTVNVPLGVQFGIPQAAAIVNAGQLVVGQGQNLSLSGGTVVSTGQLFAPGGQVAITTIPSNGAFGSSPSSLSNLLSGVGGGQNFGLTVTDSGAVELIRSGLSVEAGDIVIAGAQGVESLQAGTAKLSAAHNLTLVESQLNTTGNLNLLARNTVRVRDSVANPFIAKAVGNLYMQGNQGIDILALNHPETPFQSAGNLSLVSDGLISGDAHFASGGNFLILNLSGKPGHFVSLYDPIISSVEDVILGDYTGVSLKVESMGSITTGNITITGPDTSLTPDSDPDISILRSGPALILRAGVLRLENPPTIPVVFYSNNFEGAVGSEWSNTSTSITPVGNRRFLGEISNNQAVSLMLDNLPSHTQATVSFDLFLIRSWDGNRTDFGPDIFDVSVAGGSTLLHTTFLNDDPKSSLKQAYPDAYNTNAGGNYPARTGAVENNTLGYQFRGSPLDSVYQVSLTLPHSANSLQLNFSSKLTEGLDDESWGIANVRVSNGPIFKTSGVVSPGSITTGNLSTPGGPVILSATSNINLNGSITSRGGNISLDSGGTINTTAGKLDSFSFNNGGAITLKANGGIRVGDITSSGDGLGGNITITSEVGEVAVAGGLIRSDTFVSGRGGDINVTARSVSLTNGARIITGTDKKGQGGNLTVTAAESVEVSGTSVDGLGLIPSALSTATGGPGSAGDLTINTKKLIVRDGGVIAASTAGAGQGGRLTVNASESIELIGTSPNGVPSGLSTDTIIGSGKAGDLTINTTGRLIVRDGAAVSVSTFGQGQGGSLTVNASSIELSGTSAEGFASGLYAQAFGAGKAGDLTITAGNLTVRNQAKVTVAAGRTVDARVPTGQLNIPGVPQVSPSPQATGDAGDIKIQAGKIFLDNQGAIAAETDLSEGGNISLQVGDYILMRHNSEISTSAGTQLAGGNGGNITINTPFIIAVPKEDSDINANAYTGNGGRVQITAQGIFGTQFRPKDTSLSDITASSTFGVNGVVEINTPDIDPSRGLTRLPDEQLPELIEQGCPTEENSFTVRGRGLPPNPGEALRTEAMVVNRVTPQPIVENRSASVTLTPPSTPAPLVEAQGWVYNAQGQVVLTAQASTTTPHRHWQNSPNCHVR